MSTQRAMKDGIGPDAVAALAATLHRAAPGFPHHRFLEHATTGLDALELKERVQHVIGALQAHLPARFPEALDIVLRAAELWTPPDPDDPMRGFAVWPLIDWVPAAGLDAHFDVALDALQQLTSLFSAEFAIRPFLLKHPGRVLERLRVWREHPDEHVRRLVSEGTRPRLPWAPQLPMFIDDPAAVLELLEPLRDDPALYVRRSVANNLNDISRDHPEAVVRTAQRWSQGASPERMWLVRHALRTLVKKGHTGALAALGVSTEPELECSFEITPQAVPMGEHLTLTVRLRSTSKVVQRLVVDFAIHYQKKNGLMAPKIFKLRTFDLAAGESVTLTKRHRLAQTSVRKLYPGKHAAELLISGASKGKLAFVLR